MRRPRRGARPCARAAAALAGMALLAARPCGARAQEAPPTGAEVVEVRFAGARAFSPDVLQGAIATTPSSCKSPALFFLCWAGIAVDRQLYDPVTVRADALRLRLFYYQRGYRAAKIEASARRVGEDASVAFRIDEGRPTLVEDVLMAGADPGLEAALSRDLPMAAGRPFSLVGYQAERDSLEARLRNRGYAHAAALAGYRIASDSPYVAHVRYDLVPGALARIDQIRVIGAKRVSPAVVRRMLTFKRGDLYSVREILRSQRNLFGLQVFRHAEITPDLDSPVDSLVPIQVQVNEGDIHRVRFGAGMNTADCVNAEGRWTSRNFLGGARRLELRGQIANVLAGALDPVPCYDTGAGIYRKLAGAVTADFTQPWFFSPLNSMSAGLFVERRTVPQVFVRTARGGYVSLSRSLGVGTSVSVGFRPEVTELQAEGDLLFCTNFTICEQKDIQVLESPHWLAPLTLSWARDRSNALFAPTHGSVLRFDGELAGAMTGSDFSYARLAAELSEYRSLGSGVVLAARLRPGWARSLGEPPEAGGLGLHPQKRFFAGGPNSVRGYAQYRLGPKVLTADAARMLAAPDSLGGAGCSAQQINDRSCDPGALPASSFDVHPVGGAALLEGNVELRVPLWWDNVRAATFLDFGQVWPQASQARLRGLALTPGIGVRYFSAIGPIRIDVGYNGSAAERLPVLTTEVCAYVSAEQPCAPIEVGRSYAPGELRDVPNGQLRALDTNVLWQPRGSLLSRLQLQFSIGQAF